LSKKPTGFKRNLGFFEPWVLVPLDRASIVTMSLPAVVWPQFSTQLYSGALLEVYVISKLGK